MAAGIIQGTVTTTTGETIELSWLVDDTGTPTKWWNTAVPITATGVVAAFGSGENGATVPRFTIATDDTLVASLATKLDTAITSLQVIDNMVLAAGTAAIGKLAANSGVNIGTVTVDATQLGDLGTGVMVDASLVTLATDDAAVVSLALIDDIVKTDDASFTPATSKVAMVGFQADESSTDSIDEGDAGAARMTLDRKIIITPEPHTAGGLSIFRSIDLDEGTLEVVKASPGQIYGMWVTNTATSTRFIKIYNATSGTAGTGTPVITIGIPGNTSDDVSGLFSSTHGIAFDTGISIGAVTAVADNDTGAPGTNDVIVNVFYK